MKRRGTVCQCLRCREVRGGQVDVASLKLDDLVYRVGSAEEHFISYVTPEDKVAGFIRLSLPQSDAPATGLIDLQDAALIREVHVYGQSLPVGAEKEGAAQHAGLGTRLLQEAQHSAKEKGFSRMAVIAAVGTRQYYIERGFERGDLYLVRNV
jgi:elongator complex protein 3